MLLIMDIILVLVWTQECLNTKPIFSTKASLLSPHRYGHRYHNLLKLLHRDCCSGELLGLEQAIFSIFCEVLDSSKTPYPLHIGLFTPQICTDLRGESKICVKRRKWRNRRKKTLPASTSVKRFKNLFVQQKLLLY